MQQESTQQHLDNELIKCIRCGACQTVCPIFKETGAEFFTARGKVRLFRAMLEDKLVVSGKIEDLFSYCLLCKACINSCPAGVKTDQLVESARSMVVERRGLPVFKRFALRLGLKNRWLFNSMMTVAPGLQWLFFRQAAGVTGMLPRYQLGLDKRRLLHPVAAKSFRSRYAEIAVTGEPGQKQVALFTGCMGNFVYPETAEAVLKILQAYGYQVVIPRNQHCCGTPARASGDMETAGAMAKILVDEFHPLIERVSAVVTFCGSCGTALKKDVPALLAGAYADKARAIANKTRDISEFIVALPNWSGQLSQEIKARVTYHDPCHLGRGQGVIDQPRALLKAIPGVDFMELPNLQVCCGSAGTFSVTHYELSRSITQRKLEDIDKTGADLVATGCSACRMQLEDGINQAGGKQKVLHTAELFAMGLGL